MVLLEALARIHRRINQLMTIIFEDIKHVIGNKKGVFYLLKRNFL